MKKHETLLREAELVRAKTGSWWFGFWTGLLIAGAAVAAAYVVLP